MPSEHEYRFGGFRLVPEAHLLLRGGEIVKLPPKAVEMLLVLVRSAGELVKKEALLQAVWPDTFVEENNLAHHISVLRKALGEDKSGRPYIETIPRRGYRFVGELEAQVEVSVGGDGRADGESRMVPRFGRRMAVGALAIGAGLVVFLQLREAGRSMPLFDSLAVLPLKNLSGDAGQEYFCEGLTESLIHEMAKIDGLRVISRTSVMRYQAERKPLPEIARELKVGAVVEGSVARFGDRVRISVQLLSARDARRLWGQSYERELAEVPKIWGEISTAVVREIRAGRVETAAAQSSASNVNREAFEAYLRGRYHWNKRTSEGIRKAIEHFRRAIDLDPAYARAYAGLADSYNQLGTVMIGGAAPVESRPLARAAAKRAIEIDEQLAEGHAALAYAQLYDWEWAAAEAGLQRSIRLSPNYAPAHLWYAHFLAMRRRFEESVREARVAVDLDPLSPILRTQLGWLLAHSRRHEEAIAEFQSVLAEEPDYLWALWQLGHSYGLTGRHAEAIQVLERAAKVADRSPSVLGSLATEYGRVGRRADARRVLAELEKMARVRYVPAQSFSSVHGGLGNTELALDWIDKAYERRENSVAWMAVYQGYEAYRNHPRFLELLRKVGLAELPGETAP